MRSSQESILRCTDDHYLKMILGSHKFLADYFEGKGAPLEPFPIPAAIYVRETGENHTPAHQIFDQSYLTAAHDWKPLTNKIKRSFNIPTA